jgi:rhodanese-related sulfurtransferase
MPSTISYDQLVARLSDGTIVLLDAQAPGWFEREHLPGAHRIDWDDIAASAGAAVTDLAAPIAVYCWNTACTGSEVAAAELERLGHREVYRYVGGKQDWVDNGGTTVAADISTS